MSLSLDFTGSNATNYVPGETQPIGPSQDNVIYLYPLKGPFYYRNLVVTYTDANSGATSILTPGIDYSPAINFPMIGVANNQVIYGALCINNNALNGTITISYQALGGNWAINPTQIFNYINQNLFNSNNAFPALVAFPALTKADGVTPLVLNTVANITLAQGLNPVVGLGLEYLPQISNSSKNVGSQVFASVQNAIGVAVGATQSGASYVNIKNNGAIGIIVAGGTLSPGDSVSLQARTGESIGPVSYDVPAGGSALITTLV